MWTVPGMQRSNCVSWYYKVFSRIPLSHLKAGLVASGSQFGFSPRPVLNVWLGVFAAAIPANKTLISYFASLSLSPAEEDFNKQITSELSL